MLTLTSTHIHTHTDKHTHRVKSVSLCPVAQLGICCLPNSDAASLKCVCGVCAYVWLCVRACVSVCLRVHVSVCERVCACGRVCELRSLFYNQHYKSQSDMENISLN